MASAMAVKMGSATALSAASASSSKQAVLAQPFVGLKAGALPMRKTSSFSEKTVSNTGRVQAMKVWSPTNNKKFETLSYLPPLPAQAIAKEIGYLIHKGWTPCIEFDEVGFVTRDNFQGCGYYDGRYWTMWKLPMFGCQDPDQVLREIAEAKNAYPNAYIRVLGFDAKRQVQCSGFLVQRPGQANFGVPSNQGFGGQSQGYGSQQSQGGYGGQSQSQGYGSQNQGYGQPQQQTYGGRSQGGFY